MNPVGGLVILLGLIAIVIGLNGSQHKVIDALRNARPGAQPQAGTGTGGGGVGGHRSGGGGPAILAPGPPALPPLLAPTPMPTGGMV